MAHSVHGHVHTSVQDYPIVIDFLAWRFTDFGLTSDYSNVLQEQMEKLMFYFRELKYSDLLVSGFFSGIRDDFFQFP